MIWHLRPGFSWQRLLEQQINQIGGVAIFVGSSGYGPWQTKEIRAFLQVFVSREQECPIIPILLPDAPIKPELPIFLQDYTWIDFRRSQPDPMAQLIWGITGKPPERKPKVEPVIKVDDLSSEKGINYTRLRDLLAAGKWKEADEETLAVMLKASSREKQGWFDDESINNFPCTDLRTIDQLWVKYSNGRFGFSVQKKIYLECGGKTDGEYYEEAWEKFGDLVGWRVKGNWIYVERAFNTSAPQGHLSYEGVGGLSGRGKLIVFFLTSRLMKCNI